MGVSLLKPLASESQNKTQTQTYGYLYLHHSKQHQNDFFPEKEATVHNNKSKVNRPVHSSTLSTFSELGEFHEYERMQMDTQWNENYHGFCNGIRTTIKVLEIRLVSSSFKHQNNYRLLVKLFYTKRECIESY